MHETTTADGETEDDTMSNSNSNSDSIHEQTDERGARSKRVLYRSDTHPEHPWRDEDLVRELYEEQELSARQAAERLDCASSTLRDWIVNHHDIEMRSLPEGIRAYTPGSRNRVPFLTEHTGHERWRTSSRCEHNDVEVHRLIAVAEHGLDAIRGKHIHHKNHIPWDNRPENLEILDPEDHRELHMKDLRYDNRQQIADVYEYTDGSQSVVADVFDVSSNTVRKMHTEFHERPAGDDTIYQGHPCAHCGDRIKLEDITTEAPYEVPNRDREEFYCSEDCRYEAAAASTTEADQ